MRDFRISDKSGNFGLNIRADSYQEARDKVVDAYAQGHIPAALKFVKLSERLQAGDTIHRADGTMENAEGIVVYRPRCTIDLFSLDPDSLGI